MPVNPDEIIIESVEWSSSPMTIAEIAPEFWDRETDGVLAYRVTFSYQGRKGRLIGVTSLDVDSEEELAAMKKFWQRDLSGQMNTGILAK